MLCEYSKDLAELFEDKVDVVFFYNPEDMVQKICQSLESKGARDKIAASGLNRVVRDKHDIFSRMEFVISCVEQVWSIHGYYQE